MVLYLICDRRRIFKQDILIVKSFFSKNSQFNVYLYFWPRCLRIWTASSLLRYCFFGQSKEASVLLNLTLYFFSFRKMIMMTAWIVLSLMNPMILQQLILSLEPKRHHPGCYIVKDVIKIQPNLCVRDVRTNGIVVESVKFKIGTDIVKTVQDKIAI